MLYYYGIYHATLLSIHLYTSTEYTTVHKVNDSATTEYATLFYYGVYYTILLLSIQRYTQTEYITLYY